MDEDSFSKAAPAQGVETLSAILSPETSSSANSNNTMIKKIYKKIVFLCLLTSFFCPPSAFSQAAPGIEWQNTIGGSKTDAFYSIKQTADGGYILGGFSQSNISGDKTEINWDTTLFTGDYWLVKTDPLGNIQWQNTIGGSNADYGCYIQQTTDGGYILGGYSYSGISGDKTENCWNNSSDYWIVKTDTAGNIQWQNTIGGNQEDKLYSIQQTTDGGYILGGNSYSHNTGDKTEFSNGLNDYWIVKTDSSGNIQWQNTIGGSDYDLLQSIQQTTDGGYILGGYSTSNISGDKTENCIGDHDYWILKITSAGNIQWQNTIGGNTHDWLYSIQQTADGGYILGGTSLSNISGDKTENSNGEDYWIVKTDSLGDIQWQNTIGGNSVDRLQFLQQTADGEYVLGGYSYSNISGDKTENSNGSADYWLLKTDVSGNIQWQNTIGGNSNDLLYAIQQTADGGYILGGGSGSNISGDKTENNWDTICIPICSYDYWIVKLFPDTITSIPTFQSSIFNLQLFPNPVTNELNVKTNKNELLEIFLFDIAARKLLQQKFINFVTINTEQLAMGLYLYEVWDKNGLYKKGKVIKY